MKEINLELLNHAYRAPIPKTLDGVMDSETMKELLENHTAERAESLALFETIRNMNSPRLKRDAVVSIGRTTDQWLEMPPLTDNEFDEIVEKSLMRLDVSYWNTFQTLYRVIHIANGILENHTRFTYKRHVPFTQDNIQSIFETIESNLNLDNTIQAVKDNLDNIEVIYRKNGAIELVSDAFKEIRFNSKFLEIHALARSLIRHTHEDWYALIVNGDMSKVPAENRSGVLFRSSEKQVTRLKLTGDAANLFREKFTQN